MRSPGCFTVKQLEDEIVYWEKEVKLRSKRLEDLDKEIGEYGDEEQMVKWDQLGNREDSAIYELARLKGELRKLVR